MWFNDVLTSRVWVQVLTFGHDKRDFNEVKTVLCGHCEYFYFINLTFTSFPLILLICLSLCRVMSPQCLKTTQPALRLTRRGLSSVFGTPQVRRSSSDMSVPLSVSSFLSACPSVHAVPSKSSANVRTRPDMLSTCTTLWTLWTQTSDKKLTKAVHVWTDAHSCVLWEAQSLPFRKPLTSSAGLLLPRVVRLCHWYIFRLSDKIRKSDQLMD